jgi:hypothetical protein
MSPVLAFLTRYVLASSLLFGLWEHLAGAYPGHLFDAVNALYGLSGMPVRMEQEAGHLLYRFAAAGSALRVEALDVGAVHLNLVPFLALILATPARPLLWYPLATLGGSVVLAATHVLCLWLGGPLAAAPFAGQSAAAAAVGAAAMLSFEATRTVLELWSLWGRYGLCLVLWWVAMVAPVPRVVLVPEAEVVLRSLDGLRRRLSLGSLRFGSLRPGSWWLVLAAVVLTSCGENGLLSGDNRPPRADAGDDGQVLAGDSLRLDGSNSYDPDEDRLEFAWTFVDGPVWVGIDSADAAQALVRLSEAGRYSFRLTVSDEHGASDQAQVVVTVRALGAGNTAPRADAGDDRSVTAGSEVLLDGSASGDAESDSLTYLWVQLSGPPVAIRSGDRSRATIVPAEAGTYRLRLVVLDEEGASAADEVVVVVTEATDAANRAPVADAGSTQHVFAGDAVQLDGRASADPDGDSLTWSWEQVSGPGLSLSAANTLTPRLTPSQAGTYEFRLWVSDGDLSASATVRVVVHERIGRVEVEGVFEESDE